MSPLKFEPLLAHLKNDPLGARLAALSVQTKVEKFILAEIMHAGNRLSGLDFSIEDKRRDLVVREVKAGHVGPIIEWVEAKMCYSDCVARIVTRKSRVDEYATLHAKDAAKQRAASTSPEIRRAILTTAIFVLHRIEPHPRHVYFPGFANRQKTAESDIRKEASRYCSVEIPRASQRSITEQFAIQLDDTTEMLCYFYGDQNCLTQF